MTQATLFNAGEVRPTASLHRGDCLNVLRRMDDASVHAIVTDPPYGLSKEPDVAEVLAHWLAGDDYEHGGGGFMGKTWDSFVPGPSVWRECLRVLKPGGHLLCFAGSRTVDLMGISIRLAGFEIRDQMQWIYGSGFPKAQSIGKAIDKAAGVEREIGPVDQYRKGRLAGQTGDYSSPAGWLTGGRRVTVDPPATPEAEQWEGWATALKPAHEPIIVARKPLSVGGRRATVATNVLTHGTGAMNIDASRIGFASAADEAETKTKNRHGDFGSDAGAANTYGDFSSVAPVDYSAPGRWPANVILGHHKECEQDCHPDCPVPELDKQSGVSKSTGGRTVNISKTSEIYGGGNGLGQDLSAVEVQGDPGFGDVGGASRFFYCAKASKSERNADLPPGSRNTHPTVKPVKLMEYLVRLVTPAGGTVLDPYVGSGTTLVAAARLGFDSIGIDRDDDNEYLPIVRMRLASIADTTEGDTP